MLTIAEDRFRNGATTERDVQQAKTVLAETQALIPRLETGLRQANNRLCVLLGSPPRDLIQELLDAGKIPNTPPEVAVGIPADLLRRRPDIRRAERELAAQSERIGIAESDLYPHFSLNGVIAVQAEDFNNLFHTPGSIFGSVGPAFRWDVLNYGRLQNNIRLQDARFQELAFTYQNQVLTAGREAEDAIVGYLRSQQETRSLEAAVQAANRTVEIARDQYRQGAVDFTAVFLFEQTLTAEQDQLTVARGNVALNLIRIFRSLGGGWELRQTPIAASAEVE
jgi:NodT family efflux transporter outer membrane factor (OMF) lipoprotein